MDANKLWGVVDVLEGWVAIQRDPASLKKWADRNLMRISIGKCQVLYLGRMHQYKLGADWLQSDSEDKGLEILVINKLSMDQQ